MTLFLRIIALGLVLALGSTWLTAWRADWREAESLALWLPKGVFVKVNGRQVHAVMRGTGPDIVLLHGASGNARDMTFRFMDLLADRYRVTAFDRPGLGYTDAAPERGFFDAAGESPKEQAEFLRAAAREFSVGTARAVRIFKAYRTDAVQVMTENPYWLARDMRGIGFKTADVIAAKLGIARDAMIRVRAGISFALSEATGEGHCGLPREDLTGLAEMLLEVPPDLIASAMEMEVSEGTVIATPVGETPCLFLAGLYHAERSIARRVRTLASGPLPWPDIDADKALRWTEERTG